MKRFLIIDGAVQVPGEPLIPHTSFDNLRQAKRFIMSLEDEAVYILDRSSRDEYHFIDGRWVSPTEEEIY